MEQTKRFPASNSKIHYLASGRKLGAFYFCGSTRSLKFNGTIVSLREKVFSVLNLLLSANGELVSRDELIQSIWRGNHYVGHSSLTTSVYTLRRIFALDSTNSVQIITAHKFGYYLKVNVPI